MDAAALISAASRKEASLSRGSEQRLVVHSVIASICSPRGPGTDTARGLGTVRPRGPVHSGETGRDTWGTGPTASPNQGPLPQRDRASLSPGPCGVPPRRRDETERQLAGSRGGRRMMRRALRLLSTYSLLSLPSGRPSPGCRLSLLGHLSCPSSPELPLKVTAPRTAMLLIAAGEEL